MLFYEFLSFDELSLRSNDLNNPKGFSLNHFYNSSLYDFICHFLGLCSTDCDIITKLQNWRTVILSPNPENCSVRAILCCRWLTGESNKAYAWDESPTNENLNLYILYCTLMNVVLMVLSFCRQKCKTIIKNSPNRISTQFHRLNIGYPLIIFLWR